MKASKAKYYLALKGERKIKRILKEDQLNR